MFFGELSFLFEVMIYVGLGLPLVNLLLGLLGGGGDSSGGELDGDLSGDLDFDLDFDIDLDVGSGGELGADFDLSELAAEASGSVDAVSSGRGVPLRFNMYCLCLSLVVMGAIGIFVTQTMEGFAQTIALLCGAAMAVGTYLLFYRFVIGPMAANNAAALSRNKLRLRRATVSFRIKPDSPGKIETRDAVGAIISYPAEMDPQICKEELIEEGKEVIITEFDSEKRLCYVTVAQYKSLNR